MAIVGGTLGTWQFVSRGMAITRETDDMLNYAVGLVATFGFWHRAFGIPTTPHLIPMAALVGIWGGIIGQFGMIRDNAPM
jgi:hypothetical protein